MPFGAGGRNHARHWPRVAVRRTGAFLDLPDRLTIYSRMAVGYADEMAAVIPGDPHVNRSTFCVLFRVPAEDFTPR